MPTSHSANIDTHSGSRDELSNRVRKTTAKTIFRQQSQPAARVAAANLFDSEPPEFDESTNLSSAQSADRKPLNLFLDDDDDDDGFNIFATKTAESLPVTGKAPSVKVEPKAIESINLFEDDDDEIDDALFGSSALVENRPKSSMVSSVVKNSILSSTPPQNALFQNLFDDEPPEDDFDFLANSSAAAIASPKGAVAPINTKVKPNETEKLPESVKNGVINMEPSSKSITEKAPAEQLPPKNNLFDVDDDEDDGFEKLIASKFETESRKEVEPKSSVDEDDSLEQLIESKVVIENISTPALGDEKSPVQSKLVDVASPLVKNLFDDESDLDIDPFIDLLASNAPKVSVSHRNEDFFEPVATSMKKEDKLTFTYASSHLFDDLPPEDDEDFMAAVAPTETKPSGLGEFYNDFSETVTVSSAEATKSQYSYLYNDEPPPDDDLFQTVKPKKSIVNDPDFSRKLNVFAKPGQLVDDLPKAVLVTKKPKKLNIGNFDINVAALLPGAKRTLSNIRSDAPQVSSSDGVENEIESVSSATSAKSVVDAGRLQNLTRNRAKVQTRRPSTRRGRQQQYQRSLEVMEDTEPDVTEDNVNANEKSKNAANETASSADLSAIRNKIEQEVRLEAVPVEIKSVIEPIAIEIVGRADLETKIARDITSNEKLEFIRAEALQEPPKIKSTDLSFLDSNDGEALDDDDWLSNVIESTAKITAESRETQEPVSKTRIETTLFDDDGDVKTKWMPDSPVAETKASVHTSSSLAFAGGRTPPLLPSESEREHDDDIFSSSPSSAPVSQKAKTSTSLFDDEDENEDDLFGKPPPMAAKRTDVVPVAVQPTKSLFGDELSDDDDLFIASKSAKKENKRMAATSGRATVLNSTKLPSGNLFSDSDGDDDDDLFGSKTKQPSIGASKSVTPNVSQNRITKAKASAVTNPLADLFK